MPRKDSCVRSSKMCSRKATSHTVLNSISILVLEKTNSHQSYVNMPVSVSILANRLCLKWTYCITVKEDNACVSVSVFWINHCHDRRLIFLLSVILMLIKRQRNHLVACSLFVLILFFISVVLFSLGTAHTEHTDKKPSHPC